MTDLVNFSVAMCLTSGIACVIAHVSGKNEKQWRRIFVSTTLLTWLSFLIVALWGKI